MLPNLRGFYKILLKFQIRNIILFISILSKYPKPPTHFPSFHHLLRFILFFLPLPRKTTQEKDPLKTPFPQAFHNPSLSYFLCPMEVVEIFFFNPWPLHYLRTNENQ